MFRSGSITAHSAVRSRDPLNKSSDPLNKFDSGTKYRRRVLTPGAPEWRKYRLQCRAAESAAGKMREILRVRAENQFFQSANNFAVFNPTRPMRRTRSGFLLAVTGGRFC